MADASLVMGNQEFQKTGNRLTSLSQEPATGNPAGVPLIALPQQPIVTDAIPLEKAHSTRSSNSSRRSLLKLQLQKLEKENALQRESIQKKYSILEQMNEDHRIAGTAGSTTG